MGTVGNIKDGLGIALDLAQAANRADDYAKLIETQQMVMSVLEENRDLRSQVEALSRELAMQSQLIRQKDDYFVLEDDQSKTGPVCPNCYERDRIVVKLNGPSKICPRCKDHYGPTPRPGTPTSGGSRSSRISRNNF